MGLDSGDCISPLGDAKGLLVINGRELSLLRIRARCRRRAPRWTATPSAGNFAFTGEGQSWTKFETFELRNDALVRTESNPAASYTYAKC